MEVWGMTKARLWIVAILLFSGLFLHPAFAQDDMVTVPDIMGKAAPNAAALLNRAGLNLGTETRGLWTASSGLPQNSVSAQSVAAGTQAKRGSTIDITVLRAPNVILIYDDKTLTLVNQTGDS